MGFGSMLNMNKNTQQFLVHIIITPAIKAIIRKIKDGTRKNHPTKNGFLQCIRALTSDTVPYM